MQTHDYALTGIMIVAGSAVMRAGPALSRSTLSVMMRVRRGDTTESELWTW